MSVEVQINGITGQSPFDIYICQSGGTNCFYINRITDTTYNFMIPKPYDISVAYMLKIIDGNGSIISGETIVS